MTKFSTTFTVVLACLVAFTAGVAIIDDSGISLTMTSETPIGGEAARVRFSATLAGNLHSLETAAAICFATDDTYEVADGALGFGIQWVCTLSECTQNYYLGAYLWSGHASVSGGVTSWVPDADLTNGSFYTSSVDTGAHPDSIIGFDAAGLALSHLPTLGDSVPEHYKCHRNFAGSFGRADLSTEIALDGDWTASDFDDGDVAA